MTPPMTAGSYELQQVAFLLRRVADILNDVVTIRHDDEIVCKVADKASVLADKVDRDTAHPRQAIKQRGRMIVQAQRSTK